MRGGVQDKYNMAELDSSKEGRERHHRSIARTFDKVGQNPWNDNLSEFERHLSELSEDSNVQGANGESAGAGT